MNENPQEEQRRSREECGRDLVYYLAVGAVIAFIVWLLLPSIGGPRESSRWRCQSALRKIGIAVYNYDQKYGCLPPAYVADKAGRPMHSWRVLLLPFLDGEALYDRYRFDEPWDSPHNLALAKDVPVGENRRFPIFHCPKDSDSSKWDTSYVMVVGPQTISNGPTSPTFNDFPDGATNTIMIVEMSDSGIHWMEPRDLKFDEMSFKINDPEGTGIRSKHPGGANVLMGDGAARTVDEKIDPKVVKGLLTRNGGEQVSVP